VIVLANNEIKLSSILGKGYGLSPKLVMIDTDLSIEAKAIYAYLSSYCGNGSTAFPSIELIQHHLKISKNRFYKYRNELINKGYVKIKRRREGQKAISNLYILSLELPQFEDIQFEDIQFEDIQNEDTNNNNLINNNLINNKHNIYIVVLDYLNKICGTSYKPTTKKTQQHINARLDEGFTVEDFIKVIDVKANDWLSDVKMKEYLRPETLFGTKFESYLNKANQLSPDVDLKENDNTPQKSGYEGRGY